MKKVQLSIDENLIDRIDKYADENYMSRSGFFTLAASQFLNQAEVVFAIRDLSLAMQKIAKDKKIDDETLERLEDFERLSRMLIDK